MVLIGLSGACSEPMQFKHNPVSSLPMGSLQSSWFVDLQLKNDPIVRLDVRDKTVYAYTAGKRVIGFDRKAGTLQLSMTVKSPDVTLLPLVELKDHLVFPNATSLEVYDTKGIYERSIPLERPLRGNASGEGNLIFFGSAGPHGGLVEAYDISVPYAPQKWEYLTYDGADVTAGTAVYSGVVYSGSEAGEIDAVSVARAQIWDTDHHNFKVYGSIMADLRTDETGLFVASRDYNLYCINRATGKLKWQYFSGSPLGEAPVTTIDTVYQYVPGKGLAALDKILGPFNRTPRWIHPTATQFLSQDSKYAYLADPRPDPENSSHTVYAIIAVDKQTMKPAFESDHKDFTVFGTNHKDGTIYAGYDDGKIYAIKAVLKPGEIGELVMLTPENSAQANVNLASGFAHAD